jgi:hypothetical protein
MQQCKSHYKYTELKLVVSELLRQYKEWIRYLSVNVNILKELKKHFNVDVFNGQLTARIIHFEDNIGLI